VQDLVIGRSVSVRPQQHSSVLSALERKNRVLPAHDTRINISILVLLSTQKGPVVPESLMIQEFVKLG
jgi:hypothetical protein